VKGAKIMTIKEMGREALEILDGYVSHGAIVNERCNKLIAEYREKNRRWNVEWAHGDVEHGEQVWRIYMSNSTREVALAKARLKAKENTARYTIYRVVKAKAR
jgi:hypothetical protein